MVHPAYAAILSKSAELQLPTHHIADVTLHDRVCIEREPTLAFAWMTHKHGTHMCWPGVELSTMSAISDGLGWATFWYVWDGCQLITCRNAEHAFDMLTGCSE